MIQRFCPVSWIARSFKNSGGPVSVEPCMELHCAWWDVEEGRCAVPAMVTAARVLTCYVRSLETGIERLSPR